MLMNRNEQFRAAYERADVVTIDGAPVALLSKLTGTADRSSSDRASILPRRSPRGPPRGTSGGPGWWCAGRGEAAAGELRERFPELPEMFVDSPRMGFELGDAEDMRLVRALQVYRPDIVIVCLGAPKQELWIDRHHADLPGAVLVGAGGTSTSCRGTSHVPLASFRLPAPRRPLGWSPTSVGFGAATFCGTHVSSFSSPVSC